MKRNRFNSLAISKVVGGKWNGEDEEEDDEDDEGFLHPCRPTPMRGVPKLNADICMQDGQLVKIVSTVH